MLSSLATERATTVAHSQPLLSPEDHAAVAAVLVSGMIAQGQLVEEFEAALSSYLGLAGGVATSTGTHALFLALKSLEVGPGDEVILPTYTCRSVWDAVAATGARPVLCDVSEDWCMTEATVRAVTTPRTRAIIVVHLFGIVADIEPICGLGVPVIEDCCQAVGARREGRMAGTFGPLCILSFHATKLLTTGEGGMVLASDPGLAARLRVLRQGEEGRLAVRHRQPLSDLQAALGCSQLARYDSFLRRRREIADAYFEHLAELSGIMLPVVVRERSIFFRFPVRTGSAFDELRAAFAREGVQVRRGVDQLLHRQLGLDPALFPAAERCFAETVSLPIYPALRDQECERVVAACHRVWG